MNSWMETLFLASRDAAVLALLVGCLLMCAGRFLPAGWRHGLWLLVAVRLLMPVLPASPTSWQYLLSTESPAKEHVEQPVRQPQFPSLITLPIDEAPDETPSVTPPAIDLPQAPTVSVEMRMTPSDLIFPIWITGVSFLLIFGLFSTWRFSRRLRKSLSNESRQGELEAFLGRLAGELHLKKTPAIRITDAVEVPALYGLFRPEILIPPSTLEKLSETELRLVLMHELGHWRRFDLGINLCLALLQAIHWFNPLVWWAFHRTRVESERATDAWVLRRAGVEGVANYGGMLLRLLERKSLPHSAYSGMVSVVESPKDLRRRMSGIASFSGRRSKLGLAASVALLIGFAAVGLTRPQDAPEEKAVSRENTTGVTFFCRVVSSDGSPVEGAEVFSKTTSNWDGEEVDPVSLAGRTDSEGICKLPVSPEWKEGDRMTYHLLVRDEDEGSAAVSKSLPDDTSEFEIVLSKGPGLRFRVTDAKGDPIVGLKLRVVTAQIPEIRYDIPEKPKVKFNNSVPPLPDGFWNAVTDEQGRCQIKDLEDGLYYVDHGDVRYGQIPGRQLQAARYNPSKNKDEVELQLMPAASVSGKLLLPDGTPVAGAQVKIIEARPAPMGGIMDETISDAAGNFKLNRLLATDYQIAVDSNAEKDALWVSEIVEARLNTGEQRENLDLKFTKGALIEGRITLGDTGAGVDRSLIGITPRGRFSPFGFETAITDVNGHFRKRVRVGKVGVYIAGSVPDGYARYVNDGEGTIIELDTKQGGTYSANISLRRQPRIHGVVVDPSGVPVVGANVTCIGSGTRSSGSYATVTTEGGEFSFGLAADVMEVRLVAEHKGRLSSVRAKYPLGKKCEVMLQDDQIGSVSGRVLDAEGNPLEGAKVSWNGENISGLESETFTDENGKYMVEKILPGAPKIFTASKNGFGQKSEVIKLEPGEADEVADLRLPPANAFVAGKVVNSKGSPVTGVQITAIGDTASGYSSASTITDRDGKFEMEGLVEGWLNFHLIKTKLDGNIGTQARAKSGRRDVVITLPDGLSAD